MCKFSNQERACLGVPEDAESLVIVWGFFGGELGGFGAVTNVLQVGSFVGGSAVSIGKQVGRIGG